MNLLVRYDLSRHDVGMPQMELSKLPGYLPLVVAQTRPSMTLEHQSRFASHDARKEAPFNMAISVTAGAVIAMMKMRKVGVLSTSLLPATHLTNFFGHEYGVDVDCLSNDETHPFWLEARRVSGSPSVDLFYRSIGAAFWQLRLDREAGSVQMSCIGTEGPLTGKGNVTQLPLAPALRADGVLLMAA
jgi:hypothetical protein